MFKAIQTDPGPVTTDTPHSASDAELHDKTGDDDQDDDRDQNIQEDDRPNEDVHDEDLTWSPQVIEEAYNKLKKDNNSVKSQENPR